MSNFLGGFGKWIKDVSSNANTTLNSKKANKLKRNLIVFGAIVLVVGITLVVVEVIIFSQPMLSFDISSFDMPDLAPCIGGIILAFLGALLCTGAGYTLKAGIAVVVTGVGTKILDTNKEYKCPNCGDSIDVDEIFCNKCGYKLREIKLCSECNTQNDFKDEFCRKCGKKL